MTDFTKAMLAEYIRLSKRETMLEQARCQIDEELPVIRTRRQAVRNAIDVYGSDLPAICNPNGIIIDMYLKGWPDFAIYDVAGDICDECAKWEPDDFDKRIKELGLSRPADWDPALAEQDWRKQPEADSFKEIFGFPVAELVEEKPEPVPATAQFQGYKPSVLTAGRWTPERIELVKRDWPTTRLPIEILRDCQALPGAPVPGLWAIEKLASDLRLRRQKQKLHPVHIAAPPDPELLAPPQVTPIILFDAGADPDTKAAFVAAAEAEGYIPIEETAPKTEVREDLRHSDIWTPERVAIIKRDWPTYRHTDDIFAELKSLPGASFWKDQISLYANTHLGVRRPKDYRQKSRRDAAAAAAEPPPHDWSTGKGVGGWLTADREIRVRTLFNHNATPEQIREGLTKLPGSPVPSAADIETYAVSVLELVRPSDKKEPVEPDAIIELTDEAMPPEPEAPSGVEIAPEPVFKIDEAIKIVPVATIVAPAPPPPRKTTRQEPVVPPNLGPPRLAKALELPPQGMISTEPIDADAATIRVTADLWGITFRGEVDLWAVNKAAERRQARPFRLVATPEKLDKRKCLKCSVKFNSSGPENWLCSKCSQGSANSLPTIFAGGSS